MAPEVLREVLGSYVKDPNLIRRFVKAVESMGVVRAIEHAHSLVEVEGFIPEAVVLGFTPQVLLAVVAARSKLGLDPSVYVVTSPEVREGKGPGALSCKLLALFEREGFVKKVFVTRMTPGPAAKLREVLEELVNSLSEVRRLGVEVIDVSGGTQFVPFAAVLAGFHKLTYSYPINGKTVIYSIDVSRLLERKTP